MDARRWALALMTASSISCTAPKVATHEKFDATKALYVMDEGPHLIAGQAFLRTINGEVRTCAGFEVQLVPINPYSTERMMVLYGSESSGFSPAGGLKRRAQPAATDPEYIRHLRTTRCDAGGNFAFDKVADGSYFLVATVVWETGQAYAPKQGGGIMRRVIAGQNSTKLILTN